MSIYIDQVETESIIKMRARLGSRGPAYCTGSGKVLLASLPDEELDRLLDGRILKRYTTRTITDPARLRQELERIRRDGFALDFGEMEPAVRCAAAPIRDYDDQVFCAVSISGPSTRIEGERLRSILVPAVLRAAQEITKELGGPAPRGFRPHHRRSLVNGGQYLYRKASRAAQSV